MNDVIVFFAVLGLVYYYAEKRGSQGFLWAGLFLATVYLRDAYLSPPEILSPIILGAITVLFYEGTRFFWDDPFSGANIHRFLRKAGKAVKSIVFAFGLGPRNRLINCSQDSRVRMVRRLILAGKFRQAEVTLKKWDADTQYFVLSSIADLGGRPDYIENWLREYPKSYYARVLSGLNFISWGWEARGSGTGDTVSADGAKNFYLRLQRAEVDLVDAIALSNNRPEPYIGLITIFMGRGDNQEELWDYFFSALRTDKQSFYAHTAMIGACTEKWGGDAEEMFKVARQGSHNSGESSPLTACIAIAHVEYWLGLQMQDLEYEAENYFGNPHVKSELREAFAEFGDGPVKSSEQIEAFNYYVFSFHMAGMYKEFSDALERLQGRYTEMPWAYHGGSIKSMLDTGFIIDEMIG